MTGIATADNQRQMGRKRINYEQVLTRLPAGQIARVDAVLDDGEKRADFLREAVSREVDRREAASQDREQK